MVADRVKIATTYPMPPEGEGGMVAALDHSGRAAPAGRPGVLRLPRHGAGRARAERRPLRHQEGAGHGHRPRAGRRLVATSTWPPRSPRRSACPPRWPTTPTSRAPPWSGGRGSSWSSPWGPASAPRSSWTATCCRTSNWPTIRSARTRRTTSSWASRPARRWATSTGTTGCARPSRCLDALFFFDHLYIGGGNARRVDRDDLGDAARAHHRGGQHGRDPGRDQALGGGAPGRLTRDIAMPPPRISIVGGGSTHWTPTLLVDFANAPALVDAEVTLFDIDPRSPCPRWWSCPPTSPARRGINLTTTGRHRPALRPGGGRVRPHHPLGRRLRLHGGTTSRSRPATACASRWATASGRAGSCGRCAASRSWWTSPGPPRRTPPRAPPQRLQPAHRPLPGHQPGDVGDDVGLCNEMVGFQFAMSLIFECGMHEVRPVVAGRQPPAPRHQASPSGRTTASPCCGTSSRTPAAGRTTRSG